MAALGYCDASWDKLSGIKASEAIRRRHDYEPALRSLSAAVLNDRNPVGAVHWRVLNPPARFRFA